MVAPPTNAVRIVLARSARVCQRASIVLPGWWNGRHDGLRSRCRKAWEFESPLGHQFHKPLTLKVERLFVWSVRQSRRAEHSEHSTIVSRSMALVPCGASSDKPSRSHAQPSPRRGIPAEGSGAPRGRPSPSTAWQAKIRRSQAAPPAHTSCRLLPQPGLELADLRGRAQGEHFVAGEQHLVATRVQDAPALAADAGDLHAVRLRR